jgi:hypothetical protein
MPSAPPVPCHQTCPQFTNLVNPAQRPNPLETTTPNTPSCSHTNYSLRSTHTARLLAPVLFQRHSPIRRAAIQAAFSSQKNFCAQPAPLPAQIRPFYRKFKPKARFWICTLSASHLHPICHLSAPHLHPTKNLAGLLIWGADASPAPSPRKRPARFALSAQHPTPSPSARSAIMRGRVLCVQRPPVISRTSLNILIHMKYSDQ